jgi:twinkle protein
MTENATLGAAGCKFFEERGISAETAARYGIFTGAHSANGVVPSSTGKIIVFPFFEHGIAVNEKYRTLDKRFWQRTGGRKTFWNADALDDPTLVHGAQSLIITEGEPDALAGIECGFPLSVSVPDGAPAPSEGRDDGTFDPEADRTGKFEFLWNNRERLRRVKRFILAVDNDAPGQRLASELLRRLGAPRCFFVTYPEGCKDLNDVLMKHGPERVTAVLNAAKPYPVRGLYRLDDYPAEERVSGVTTGFAALDDTSYPGWIKIFPGELMVVTGIPSHGKSTWVLNLCVNVAKLHRWPTALFSPEMRTVPHLRDKLRRIIRADAEWSQIADNFIRKYFTFIDNDPTGEVDDDLTLEWLLERAMDAVLRDGIRVLVIDPWNEIEHARRHGESTTEYIGRALREFKRFARQYEVAVIIIAHPTKDIAKDGRSRQPTLYDIEGSAHWFNKCDHGIVIYREDAAKDVTLVSVCKSRFEEAGEQGGVRFRFDRETQTFMPLDMMPRVARLSHVKP